MTSEQLNSFTRKKLAAMAKRQGVDGWHSMRKAQLVEALATESPARRRKPSRTTSRKSSPGFKSPRQRSRTTTAQAKRKTASAKQQSPRKRAGSTASQKRKTKSQANANHDVARRHRHLLPAASNGQDKDSLRVTPCDSHWLHIHWGLTQKTLARAEAALKTEWHQAVPVLRLFDVTADDSDSTSKVWVSDSQISSEDDNWYLRIEKPQRSYRMQLGYLAPSGKFFVLTRSNLIKPLQSGSAYQNRLDKPTSGLNSEKNGRANGSAPFPSLETAAHHAQAALKTPHLNGSANGGPPPSINGGFEFQLRAELLVHGATHPHAQVSLLGHPVSLGEDGTFSLRLSLPEGRQVIPAAAVTPNGTEQHTIVLAVERNTKELEPQVFDQLQF